MKELFLALFPDFAILHNQSVQVVKCAKCENVLSVKLCEHSELCVPDIAVLCTEAIQTQKSV